MYYQRAWGVILTTICATYALSQDIDQEVHQTAYEIIASKGYQADEYKVLTEDGYYLTLHRIRNKTIVNRDPRKVALLQHGLVDSAHTWIANPANESLGFILADAGFDVWLGNSRGSTYSQEHKYLSPESEDFWAFSWDEMAMYDLPAFVEFILKETGAKKLFYVGHSQGGEMALAQLNRSPELRSRVAAFAALAPVAHLGDVQNPLKLISPLCSSLTTARYTLGGGKLGRFLLSSWLTRIVSTLFCKEPVAGTAICNNYLFFIAGSDIKNLNATRLPVYVAHYTAGTSVQNMAHYCQGMRNDRFEAFDFGSASANKARYNQSTPPAYGLDLVASGATGVPVRVYWGRRDLLATPEDIQRILKGLKQNAVAGVDVSDVEVADYNHMDFVWAFDAAKRVYPDVMNFFNRHLSACGAGPNATN